MFRSIILAALLLAGCCTPKPPAGYPPHYDEPVYGEEVAP